MLAAVCLVSPADVTNTFPLFLLAVQGQGRDHPFLSSEGEGTSALKGCAGKQVQEYYTWLFLQQGVE